MAATRRDAERRQHCRDTYAGRDRDVRQLSGDAGTYVTIWNKVNGLAGEDGG